jgi:hypothetical protein
MSTESSSFLTVFALFLDASLHDHKAALGVYQRKGIAGPEQQAKGKKKKRKVPYSGCQALQTDRTLCSLDLV